MRVAVTGSTGLIGTRLVESLIGSGHQVRALVRPGSTVDTDHAVETAEWDPAAGTIDTDSFDRVDAVVHLAGAGIGDARWTVDRKALILHSRTRGTDLIARTLAGLERPPAVLLSASGIGYYGDTADRPTDESGAPGTDFPAHVCIAWEAAAQPAIDAGVRVAFLRTGIVLANEGGALARQLPVFRMGLGGRFGSGRQHLSWITIDDEVRAIRHLLDHDVSGPVNLVSPNPTTNAEFTRALGRVLRRPTTVIPMIGPRTLFGRELADSLLLTSQRILPGVLQDSGFEFADADLEQSLRRLLDR